MHVCMYINIHVYYCVYRVNISLVTVYCIYEVSTLQMLMCGKLGPQMVALMRVDWMMKTQTSLVDNPLSS